MHGLVEGRSSPDCSDPEKPGSGGSDLVIEVNPLDVVFEAVSALCDHTAEQCEWVPFGHLVEMAVRRGVTPEDIFEALRTWVALGIMTTCDSNSTYLELKLNSLVNMDFCVATIGR